MKVVSIVQASRTLLIRAVLVPMFFVGMLVITPIAASNLGLQIIPEADAANVCLHPATTFSGPTYTTSLTITVNYSAISCSGTPTTSYPYAYIWVSLQSSCFGSCSTYQAFWKAPGTNPSVPAGSVTFALNNNGGNTNQGNHNYWIGVNVCSGSDTTNQGSFISNQWAPAAMVYCTTISNNPGPVAKSVVYDNVAPTTPSVASPTSTLLTSATGAVFSLNGSSDATSGMNRYEVKSLGNALQRLVY